jgi:hypothetical protein
MARVLLVSVLATCALCASEARIARDWIPVSLLKEEIQLLAPDFGIVSADIAEVGQHHTFRFRAYVSRLIQVGDRALLPAGWGGGRTVTVWDATVPIRTFTYWALLFTSVLAWPVAGLRELVARAMLSVPCAATLLLIDVPSTALATLWTQANGEMGVHPFSGWEAWSGALMDGGGLVLALLLGGMAILGARYLAVPRPASRGDSEEPQPERDVGPKGDGDCRGLAEGHDLLR